MKTAIERFERYLRRRYGDRSTPKHYLSDLRLLTQVVGAKSPQEVTTPDIDRWVDQQVAQGRRPTTINRRLAAVHTFFEFLAAEVPDQPWPNPVVWRRHGITEGHPLPRDLADATVDHLCAVMPDLRDRAVFGLMVGAGLRVGEVAALTLGDLEAPPAATELARLRVHGKGQKERVVWLTPAWYAVVQAWLDTRPASGSDHLFLNQHGQPLHVAGIQYRLREYATQAGVPATCHQLRHTFARRLAEQELPLESLAKLLGHAQVTTTQLYTAGADPQLRRAFATAMAQLAAADPGPAPGPTGAAADPEPAPGPTGVPAADPAATPGPTGAVADPAPAPGPTGVPAADPAATPDPIGAAADPELAPGPTQVPAAAAGSAPGLVPQTCLAVFDPLPAWLQPALQAYLIWRWRQWQPHLAATHGQRLARQLRRIWDWLLAHQTLTQWSDLQRSHLEAWLAAPRPRASPPPARPPNWPTCWPSCASSPSARRRCPRTCSG